MGFLSSLMKNTMDRNIPLVHPHLEEVDGEVHHKKRYDKYPGHFIPAGEGILHRC